MRWVSLGQLSKETGFAVRTLQLIRDREPGVLVTRDVGAKTEYSQPASVANLFKREREIAKREASVMSARAELQRRRDEAETRLAEMDVAEREAQLVGIDQVDLVVAEVVERLRAGIINMPGNYGLRLEELGIDAAKAEAVLVAIAEDLTRLLRAAADELEALPVDDATAAD